MLPFSVASNSANWGQSKPRLHKATESGAIEPSMIALLLVCLTHWELFFKTEDEGAGRRSGGGQADGEFSLAFRWSIGNGSDNRVGVVPGRGILPCRNLAIDGDGLCSAIACSAHPTPAGIAPICRVG
jgi:hypothetical protein